MKKVIKYVLIVLGLFIIFNILFTTSVKANTISSIAMDIFIDSKGNANVTEIWKITADTGTEGYRTYSNLEKSTITNFSVTDDKGNKYTTLSEWDTNGTLASKAYKCGINKISGGLELCWGISEYGSRTYTLKYTINNFVTQYTDVQGIYSNFLEIPQDVGNAIIKIHSDVDFSLDNARIWAFGNNGSINFVDGAIILKSDGQLSSGQYMVGLVRFEDNLFNTSNKSSKSFDDIYDSAMSTVTNNDLWSKFRNIFGYVLIFIFVLLFALPLILAIFKIIQRIFEILMKSFKLSPVFTIIIILINIYLLYKSLLLGIFFILFGLAILTKVHEIKLHMKKSKFDKKLPTLQNPNQITRNLGNVDYWREIPFNENLWCTALAIEFFYDFSYSERYLLGAILLKWVKNNNITVCKTKKGLFNIKDNNYAIAFNNTKNLSSIELSLWTILRSASGINNILEANELKKWCKKHYDKMFDWFKECKLYEQNEAKKIGVISKEKYPTVELEKEAKKLLGFRNFLLDFSLMPERECFDVHLWENYLVFAELLGIADKVEEQFSKIYPKFNELSKLDTDISTLAIRNLADITYVSINEGKTEAKDVLNELHIKSYDHNNSSRHDYSGRDRDSGGGGSSYSSGGRSAGGSSGGGFR